MSQSIRNQYADIGVSSFYSSFGDSYSNPHELIIQNHLDYFIENSLIDTFKILDLCCGSGEVSRHLLSKNIKNIQGLDPFTYKSYTDKTGLDCFQYDFNDIVNNKLSESFSLIICSFALHLAPKSMLNQILFNLSTISKQLLIISPHKKPEINNFWLIENELYREKVRSRLFSSEINL